jgi:hypothetical protein
MKIFFNTAKNVYDITVQIVTIHQFSDRTMGWTVRDSIPANYNKYITSSSKHPDQLFGSPGCVSSGYREFCPWGRNCLFVRLTSQLHLMLTLRLNVAVTQPPFMPFFLVLRHI